MWIVVAHKAADEADHDAGGCDLGPGPDRAVGFGKSRGCRPYHEHDKEGPK